MLKNCWGTCRRNSKAGSCLGCPDPEQWRMPFELLVHTQRHEAEKPCLCDWIGHFTAARSSHSNSLQINGTIGHGPCVCHRTACWALKLRSQKGRKPMC